MITFFIQFHSFNSLDIGYKTIKKKLLTSFTKETETYFEESDQGITSSEESNISVRQVSVTAGGTKRGRKPKINATKENTIEI